MEQRLPEGNKNKNKGYFFLQDRQNNVQKDKIRVEHLNNMQKLQGQSE